LNLAVVGWAADSGVGRELIDALGHLPISSAFILRNPEKVTRRDLVKVPCSVSSGINVDREMEVFLDHYKPDTILTWEVPGSWGFPGLWAAKGIRWIHVVHWDWFAQDKKDVWKKATTLIAPNRMCYDALRIRKYDPILLPVPVDTDKFAFKLRAKADHFVSIYAYGGPHERRSLREIFECWKGLEDPPRLTIFAQKRPSELGKIKPAQGIEVLLGNAPDPWMLYEEGDVAVQPSRFEGVGVSMVEAQACGLPVVALDAPPMNEIAPDLPVAVQEAVMVEILGKKIPSHIPDVDSFRDRISSIAGKDISGLSRQARKRAEDGFSWRVLRPQWMDVLEGAKP
jgi:glycosyltransferase involved in cell wall biosynthesis